MREDHLIKIPGRNGGKNGLVVWQRRDIRVGGNCGGCRNVLSGYGRKAASLPRIYITTVWAKIDNSALDVRLRFAETECWACDLFLHHNPKVDELGLLAEFAHRRNIRLWWNRGSH